MPGIGIVCLFVLIYTTVCWLLNQYSNSRYYRLDVMLNQCEIKKREKETTFKKVSLDAIHVIEHLPPLDKKNKEQSRVPGMYVRCT